MKIKLNKRSHNQAQLANQIVIALLFVCYLALTTKAHASEVKKPQDANAASRILNSATWFASRTLPKECSVVFKTWYDAHDRCPYSAPVFEVFDFWTRKSAGFACMCGADPADLPASTVPKH